MGGINSLTSYSKIFEKNFPYFLSIGMSYEEYWHGEPFLTKSYLISAQYREQNKNRDFWLQGLYVFRALCSASPLFHDLYNSKNKQEPYPSKPFDFFVKKKVPTKEDEELEAKAADAYMNRLMRMVNRARKEAQ